MPLDGRLEREREFHDQLAAELDPGSMPPTGLGELAEAMLAATPDLQGKRVLDLGCGDGNLTLALVNAGARVIAIDLSPGMVDVARRRVEWFAPGGEAEFIAAPAEELPIPDGTVDLIVGRFILHHLAIPQAGRECARVLSPDAQMLFIENSGRNPLLRFARDKLAGRFGIARYGTADERPLTAVDMKALERVFPDAHLEYPVFDFLKIFDRQVLRYRWKAVSTVLSGLDKLLWRLPLLRPWSFRVLLSARR